MDVNYWFKLPYDIVEEITKRLVDIDDYVRFAAVCKSWPFLKQSIKTKQFSPWLLLPEGEIDTQDHDTNDHIRKFFSLSTRKTLYLNLLETRGRRCFGSPFGWLFTIGLDLNIHLLNPLTRIQIPLPSQPTFQYQYQHHVEPRDLRRIFVARFAMSSNTPNSDQDCVVMVIYSQYYKLSFARPCDKTWTAVDSPPNVSHKDVICFRGQFYVVTGQGKLMKICEMDTPHPRSVDFMPPPEDVQSCDNFYLLEMCGDLHLVVRIYDQDETAPEGVFRYETKMFEVYKLDFVSMEWIELFHLGDYALFVGTNAAFAVLTTDNPEIKANSIYFTDDQDDCYKHGDGGGHDMGILIDFPNEKFERFYFGFGDDIYSSYCPPLFFMPRLS